MILFQHLLQEFLVYCFLVIDFTFNIEFKWRPFAFLLYVYWFYFPYIAKRWSLWFLLIAGWLNILLWSPFGLYLLWPLALTYFQPATIRVSSIVWCWKLVCNAALPWFVFLLFTLCWSSNCFSLPLALALLIDLSAAGFATGGHAQRVSIWFWSLLQVRPYGFCSFQPFCTALHSNPCRLLALAYSLPVCPWAASVIFRTELFSRMLFPPVLNPIWLFFAPIWYLICVFKDCRKSPEKVSDRALRSVFLLLHNRFLFSCLNASCLGLIRL